LLLNNGAHTLKTEPKLRLFT